MREFCYRCGGDLPETAGESQFCPHCGAPQLFLTGHEEASALLEEDGTGAPPPPKPQTVEWKTAIRCALLVAAVGVILSLVATKVPALSALSSLWLVSGSIIALGLYQRRRPLSWMDAAVGARIGMVVGLTLVMALAAMLATAGLIARYGLHNTAALDAEMAQMTPVLHAQMEHAAATNPVPPEMWKMIDAPEFRVGIMLMALGMAGCFLFTLSVVGGALGGLLRTRRGVAA